MSTLLHRGRGLTRDNEMSESTSAKPAEHPAEQAGSERRPGAGKSGAGTGKSRKQRTWVPGVAAFVCLLIGISDIVAIFKPAWHDKLQRINGLVPGTLTNVKISAYVIIGLLLLLLSHGLRRRK